MPLDDKTLETLGGTLGALVKARLGPIQSAIGDLVVRMGALEKSVSDQVLSDVQELRGTLESDLRELNARITDAMRQEAAETRISDLTRARELEGDARNLIDQMRERLSAIRDGKDSDPEEVIAEVLKRLPAPPPSPEPHEIVAMVLERLPKPEALAAAAAELVPTPEAPPPPDVPAVPTITEILAALPRPKEFDEEAFLTRILSSLPAADDLALAAAKLVAPPPPPPTAEEIAALVPRPADPDQDQIIARLAERLPDTAALAEAAAKLIPAPKEPPSAAEVAALVPVPAAPDEDALVERVSNRLPTPEALAEAAAKLIPAPKDPPSAAEVAALVPVPAAPDEDALVERVGLRMPTAEVLAEAAAKLIPAPKEPPSAAEVAALVPVPAAPDEDALVERVGLRMPTAEVLAEAAAKLIPAPEIDKAFITAELERLAPSLEEVSRRVVELVELPEYEPTAEQQAEIARLAAEQLQSRTLSAEEIHSAISEVAEALSVKLRVDPDELVRGVLAQLPSPEDIASKVDPSGAVQAAVEAAVTPLAGEARAAAAAATAAVDKAVERMLSEVQAAKDALPTAEQIEAMIPEPVKGDKGEPGPRGEIAEVREWEPETVAWPGQLWLHRNALYQVSAEDPVATAPGDAPGWRRIIAAPNEFRMLGRWEPEAEYRTGNAVCRDRSLWIAVEDNPGPCPGDGWRLAAQGQKAQEPLAPFDPVDAKFEPGKKWTIQIVYERKNRARKNERMVQEIDISPLRDAIGIANEKNLQALHEQIPGIVQRIISDIEADVESRGVPVTAYRGHWSEKESYQKGDLTRVGHSLWICTKNGERGNPALVGSNWLMMASLESGGGDVFGGQPVASPFNVVPQATLIPPAGACDRRHLLRLRHQHALCLGRRGRPVEQSSAIRGDRCRRCCAACCDRRPCRQDALPSQHRGILRCTTVEHGNPPAAAAAAYHGCVGDCP